MPWTAEYFENGASLRYSGRTTGDDILAARQQVFAHPFPGGARFMLCDFSGVEIFDVSSSSISQIVDQDRRAVPIHPKLVEAVVAPTPLEFGLARMWQACVDEVRPNTAVTRTRSEAIAWLAKQGISPLPEETVV